MRKIAILGYGTVGKGVYKIIKEKFENSENTEEKIIVKKVLLKENKKPQEEIKNVFTYDYEEILGDKEIDTIVEVTGAMEEGHTYIKKALSMGKNIISTNKALVAKHLEEYINLAEKNKVSFLFEGAVGGAIPILRELRSLKKINEITKIEGVLNGTGNYILDRMTEKNLDYSQSLKNAQDLGYAEKDPSDDVLGFDGGRKLVLLISLSKSLVKEEDIEIFGIEKIKKEDIERAKAKNLKIRHIAYSEFRENSYVAILEPCLIDEKNDFYNLEDAKNLVKIYGKYFEELSIKGKGAGMFPTANAVLQDLLSLGQENYTLDTGALENKNENFQGIYYLRVPGSCKIDLELADKIDMENGYIFIKTKKLIRKNSLKSWKD
ncbi:homoserine dehydrogenase [Peptoniphilus sp. BV3C26]|uniref:homoserine dehydrogenase n=1 Tax=Peptoniphilus sp. BV3C26 TaxID=1111134 RepID=UPI0003B8E129|nr:homoserine dehydrogenase [Peptoniphilus sp. BV3C26]ERT57498.1 homoserine dehydrogenase [Peptoniphilus sp. BV3C26]